MNSENLTMGDFMAPSRDTVRAVLAETDEIIGYATEQQRTSSASIPKLPASLLEVTATLKSDSDDLIYRVHLTDLTSGMSIAVGEPNLSQASAEYFSHRIEELMVIDGLQRYAIQLGIINDSLLTNDPVCAVQHMVGRGSDLPVSSQTINTLTHTFEDGDTIDYKLIECNTIYADLNRKSPNPERSTIALGQPLWENNGSYYRYAVLPDRSDHQRIADMWLIEHDVASAGIDEAEERLRFDTRGATQGAYLPTEGSLGRFAAKLARARQGLEREFGPLE